MTTALMQQTIRRLLEENHLPSGSSLEDRVTWRLHRWGILDECQYRVGKYRLDYAWPSKLIALEADGPFHWQPQIAMRDAMRDSWLRAQGWLVFRINDADETGLDEQLCRVVRMIRAEDENQ